MYLPCLLTGKEKLPSASVTVPFTTVESFEANSRTEAEISGSPAVSMTRPVMLAAAPYSVQSSVMMMERVMRVIVLVETLRVQN